MSEIWQPTIPVSEVTIHDEAGRIWSLAEWNVKQREERREGQLDRIEALLERIAAALETRAS